MNNCMFYRWCNNCHFRMNKMKKRKKKKKNKLWKSKIYVPVTHLPQRSYIRLYNVFSCKVSIPNLFTCTNDKCGAIMHMLCLSVCQRMRYQPDDGDIVNGSNTLSGTIHNQKTKKNVKLFFVTSHNLCRLLVHFGGHNLPIFKYIIPLLCLNVPVQQIWYIFIKTYLETSSEWKVS